MVIIDVDRTEISKKLEPLQAGRDIFIPIVLVRNVVWHTFYIGTNNWKGNLAIAYLPKFYSQWYDSYGNQI